MAVTRFTMLASLLVIVFIVTTRAAEVGGLLAPKLQGLLRQEMRAVLIATDEIINASIEGDYAMLADRAQQIHDSFILEQAMTEEDRRTCCTSFLPISSNSTRDFTHSQLNWPPPGVLVINSWSVAM